MTGRPIKIKNKTIIAISLSDEIMDWIDKLCETPYGRLARPEVIRNLLIKIKKGMK